MLISAVSQMLQISKFDKHELTERPEHEDGPGRLRYV